MAFVVESALAVVAGQSAEVVGAVEVESEAEVVVVEAEERLAVVAVVADIELMH